jgi:hypothetical protein
MGEVYNLCRVKTDRSVVLTVKSGLDPHMIMKLKDKLKLWFLMVLSYGYIYLSFWGWYKLTSSHRFANKTWSTLKCWPLQNLSLALIALHVSPTCWAPTLRVLTLAYRYSDENNGEEYWSDFEEFWGMRSPSHVPADEEEEVTRLVIVYFSDLRVHCLSVIMTTVPVKLLYGWLLLWYYTLLSIVCV